ncbi:MAG: hypothetical protein ACKOCD_04155 [Nitrospiraceae bacterium]
MVEPVLKASPLLMGMTLLLVLAIFILDIFTPVGITIPLLYTIPLLLALLISDRRFFRSVAAVAAVLTPLGFYVSPPGGIAWMGITNRARASLVLGSRLDFIGGSSRCRSCCRFAPLAGRSATIGVTGSNWSCTWKSMQALSSAAASVRPA